MRPEPDDARTGDGYDFYPGRDLITEEFEAIWSAQARHHPEQLTPEVHDRLFEIVFHQRPLKRPKVGSCTLVSGECRLPRAHPLFQHRRLLEEVNALTIVHPGEAPVRLTMEQRNALLLRLKVSNKVSFESLRKLLKIDPDARFNKETLNRKELKGNEVAAELSAKARFGKRWFHLSHEEQWAIISRLLEEEQDSVLHQWLVDSWELTDDQAKAVAKARLPQGYGRFGHTATIKLIAALEADVVVYSQAVEAAGLGHHSDLRTGASFLKLPYYGVTLERHLLPGTAEPSDPEEMRIGRLTNPTVHIALNQLRRVVNRLIRRYGMPAEIAVEIARDLKSTDDDRKRFERENRANRLAAESRSRKLREIGQRDTGANRQLLKLWEELNAENSLDRRCIYSGRQISVDMLFNGTTEVDHILPFEETWDDSNANKTLCLREANRAKGKRSPHDAFGHTADWDAISARAARLPDGKRWRFQPDAMRRFDLEGGFLARHLVDTQYLSRLAHLYLSALYSERGEGSGHVWVSPGRLTELVRRKLGLNDLLPDHNVKTAAEHSKNRLDHRHHAIDAAVVAIVDRRMLQAISRASGQEGAEGSARIRIPNPWDGFRDELRRTVNDIVVSHRADHGLKPKAALKQMPPPHSTAGRLHNDTAYGITEAIDENGNTVVVHRIPLIALKPADVETGGKRRVADDTLRTALADFTRGKDFDRTLKDFPKLGPLHFRGIRRVRVLEPLTVIPIRDEKGRVYKGYKGDSNYRYDVWELKDGKWEHEVVSMFDIHQPGWSSRIRDANPTARKVLSLHQSDLVAIEPEGGERKLMRVVKFGQNGQITLAEPHESGDLKRRDAVPVEEDPFKYIAPTAGGLKKLRTRQVRIDEVGRVFDPGFPARKRRGTFSPAPER
nr:type II CRISPR RNA-guided endonuclease Cas9 [Rhodoplanes sp.]